MMHSGEGIQKIFWDR